MTAGEYAEQILVEIHADMEQPFPWGKQIPADVGSFSLLHDYCDANEYLIDTIPQDALTPDAWTDLLNEVSDLVDRRLAAEAIELDTGDRCACWRLIRFAAGHVVHIDGDRSHACEPCEFCLYCPRCHRPLEGRRPFDGRLPSSGVPGGHEGFGTCFICESGHWWTWLNGALIPPERILTVIEEGS